MASTCFSDGEAIRFGWNSFKQNVGFLIGAVIVGAVAMGVPIGVSVWIQQESPMLSLVFMLLYYVVALIIGLGFLKIFIKLSRSESASFGDLFNNWNRLLPYIGVNILYALIVMGGMLLLVFPGIIWMLKFYWAQYLVVDKGMGPIEALKASARMTDGMKWDLLAFISVIGVVVMIGYFALLIGMVVTIPVAAIATCWVYNYMAKGMPAGEMAKAGAPKEMAEGKKEEIAS